MQPLPNVQPLETFMNSDIFWQRSYIYSMGRKGAEGNPTKAEVFSVASITGKE